MLYVEKRESAKGQKYFALVVDLGYVSRVLTLDKYIIAEIMDMSIRELYELTEPRTRVGHIEYIREV